MSNLFETYWPEKYRPAHLKDCLIDGELMGNLDLMIRKRTLPHVLLYGPPGISKTSVAKCIANDMNADCLFISGSLEGRNIDTVRTTIIDFAMASSLSGKPKIVLIDEADRLNRESVQPALRTLMEDVSDSVRFILTCNEVHRVIDALRSRCFNVDMSRHTMSKAVKVAAIKRVIFILDQENVAYDKKAVVSFVNETFPDIRQIITRLQQAASNDAGIGSEILIHQSDSKHVLSMVTGRKFSELREWASANATPDTYLHLQDILVSEVYDDQNLAQLVMVLAEYGFRSTSCADPAINLAACLFEISMKVKFR